MRGIVFSGIELVRIIEVLDKRGPDNQGCTVVHCTNVMLYGMVGAVSLAQKFRTTKISFKGLGDNSVKVCPIKFFPL
jgi:hypothetical protein